MNIALAGNPNSGKTTLFNALTGSNQYVGNWPGVTVERKEARFQIEGEEATLVDLPGTYSLSPYSIEENIARGFIEGNAPDVVLNIVDATNIERNLYLTLQLMELERPLVVALNLMDELERRGVKPDCGKLSRLLGVPVVPISAKRKQGFDALFAAIDHQARRPAIASPVRRYDAATRRAIEGIGGPPWAAIRMLEGDAEVPPRARKIVGAYVAEGQKRHPGIDALTLMADARYRLIERVISEAGFKGLPSASDRIDKVLTHKVFAFPIFLSLMALMFFLTFGWGAALSALVEEAVSLMADGAGAALSLMDAPRWLRSLLLNGVFSGVGGVLVFLPQILIIFLFMSILEDSGYMSRAAFITDRILRRFGLSGRSFIPMLMGFGCTTTAVIAARAVENERDRRMTILLTPFMSCGAKLPVYALFTAALFPKYQGLVVLSLYLLGMLLMVAAGMLLRKTAFREGETPFVMELPAYRRPSVRNVARRLWDRAKDFLTRAGTVIFLMSIAVWFLQAFSPDFRMVSDSAQSIFGRLGALIAPLFAPLGFGTWEKGVALLSGMVAKEAVVSTLQVLYAAESSAQLGAAIAANFTPRAAYAFLVFTLLYMPCVSAMAAIRRELGSRRWTLFSIGLQMGTAYLGALIAYHIRWVHLPILLIAVAAWIIIRKTKGEPT